MNKFKIISLSLLLGLSVSSCEDILFENVSPDYAHTNEANQGLPVVVFYAQQTVYDHSEYYVYLSQCLTTTGKSQTGSYPYKQGWEFLNINRHPQWRRHFYDIGVNVNYLIENSQNIGSPNYELIGRTIRLMSSQLTTDAFGDMPRTEAYQSSAPHYDTQASIYEWMFEEADELIALYDDAEYGKNPNNEEITKSMDRVYAGNLDNWKGLVYAVKARLLLRNLPNIDRSSSTCQSIIDCAQKAIDIWRSGDMLYGSWFGSEPRYNFDGGTGEQNAPWSSAQPKINSWESRANLLDEAVPSKFFIEDCLGVINPGVETSQGYWDRNNGYGCDPRLMLLLVPQSGPISATNSTSRVMIRYLENNIGSGAAFTIANYPNLFAGAYAGGVDAYNPIFTMEELYFIQAEAYYWMGNKTKACELTKEAAQWNIQRHLDRFIADNGCYPGSGNEPGSSESVQESDQQRFERIVTAFLDNEATSNTKACSQIGNEHWFFNPSEFTLSDLMIQKWIAMYMQPEQWTDMRRYHYSNKRNGYGIGDSNEIIYPNLRRPYNLYAPYWVDGRTDEEKENLWLQRINYDPETEDIYNTSELIRLGEYQNYEWLQKPMNWAHDYGYRTSLTAEEPED